MNQTVLLVNEWAAFEEKHPEADLADFCRYYLTQQRASSEKGELVGGIQPPQPDLLLIKIIDRIARLYRFYAEAAIAESGVRHFEEFLFLNAIAHLRQPRKTEVITHTLNELSSGLLIIDRLKKYGYVLETDDPTDKRSRRLTLTPVGTEVLHRCYGRTAQLGALFFGGMAEQDILLSIQLLKMLEIRFSKEWPQHKGRAFEAIRKELAGE